MRSLGIVTALVAAASIAHAELPPAKGPPPEYGYLEHRTFIDAMVAERNGDFRGAERAYAALNRDHASPNVSFNLARIYVQVSGFSRAVGYFEAYLKGAPDAADAAQVKKVLAELAAKKRPIVLGASHHSTGDVDATILIDGEVVGKSPMEVMPDGRRHRVARVGATSVSSTTFDDGNSGDYVSLSGDVGKGNVYIDRPDRYGDPFEIGGQPAATSKLFTLKPGRYSTSLSKSLSLCSPIELEVKAKTLTFVYLEEERDEVRSADNRTSCVKVSKVKIRFFKQGAQ